MGKEILLSKNGKTLYRDGDLVYKVFDHTISKSEPFNEALINTRIEELPELHVAAIREISLKEDGWTIARDYIDGVEIKHLISAKPEKTRDYMDQMLRLQMTVHSQHCPLLPTMHEKLSRQILDVEETILDDARRFDLLTRLDNMPKHRKLCHGEFCPENIVVKENGEMYILDWVHATQGNSSADAARTFLILCLEYPPMADYYLQQYCDLTHTDMGYVRNWIPIVAAAQLSKQRPQEKDLLLRWVSMTEN